jgi:general secretion pathway protein G
MMYQPVEKNRMRFLQRGFTLIELMIGLVIIGLITGAAMYFIPTYLENARRSSTQTTLQNFKVQLMNYNADKGEYPKSLQDMKAAGYLDPKKPLPKDGWGNNFVYRVTPDGKNPYELFSYGPQGKGGPKAGRMDAWAK